MPDLCEHHADVMELDQPTKEQKMSKTTDDEGGIVRCECGRAVPCRHCPTPIDPADIRPGSRVGAGHVRPGDVLDITYRVTVTAVGDECDIETDDRQRKHNLHAFNATGHLVHRPDPDAEAVEALAEFLHEDSGCEDVWPCQSGAPYHRNRARAALDLVRRAES